MIRVSAPGNLFGSEEHVCVYTKTALLVSPEVRTTFNVEKSEKPEISVFSSSLNLKATVPLSNKLNLTNIDKKLVPTFRLIEKISQDLEKELEPMSIVIDSEIPVGSGLSSSTALLVSGYFATAKYLGADPWKLSSDEVYQRIFPLQEFIHGKASGMEIFSSHLGGFSLIKNRKLVKHYKIEKNEQPVCIIGDTRISRQTSNVVAMVSKWKDENPSESENIFSKIQQITKDLDKAITKKDWSLVGKLMTENHNLLRKMGLQQKDKVGVSHKVLDAMVEAAIKAGAYGAKMSGAGWGGVMFAICPKESEKSVLKAISQHGKAYATKLGAKGVQLES